MFGALIAILLVASLIIETSFIHTLPDPLQLFPLAFILGILVIHRGHLALGVAWLSLMGPLFSLLGFDDARVWSYVFVALIAIPLSMRIFVERSVYAMEGLGILLFIFFSVLNTPLGSNGQLWEYIQMQLITLALLAIGLYVAFLLLLPLERFAKNFLPRS